MSNFARFFLLALFGAAGVGAGLYVAFSDFEQQLAGWDLPAFVERYLSTAAAAETPSTGDPTTTPGAAAQQQADSNRAPHSDGAHGSSQAASSSHAVEARHQAGDLPLQQDGGQAGPTHDRTAGATAPQASGATTQNPAATGDKQASKLAMDLERRPLRPPVAQQAPPGEGGSSVSDVVEMMKLMKGIMETQSAAGGAPASPTGETAAAAGAAQRGQPGDPFADDAPAEQVPAVSKTEIRRHAGEGDANLSITIQGDDIRAVLELLSEQGALNILTSPNVQGTVTASLKQVSIEEALDAILRSTGYVWQREGQFIYVGTHEDFQSMKRSDDRVGTRLYRPNYVKAADLQTLITPLLTPSVGTVSISAPAEVGIGPDTNTAGGDGFAGQEVLLVRDYEAVLYEIDQVVRQIDLRPTQVSIEAMILSVRLDDSNRLGVNFEFLRDRDTIRLMSGDPVSNLAQIETDSGGLKVGFLDASLSAFIEALETIGDTNVIATPHLMCLNKHRAEILIGEQLGFVSTTQTETSTTQSVEFLEVGTQLRIRPFISSDGLVRMEVHPELSTGTVTVQDGFTLPDKVITQVTTNIMVRDGNTVIIGGLLRDEMTADATQIPLLGSLPLVGPAFRQITEENERREILVLITPRIVYEPGIACRGDEAAAQFHQRHAVYADKMSPLGKRYVGRKYFRLAQDAWAAADQQRALRLINLAIHFDPMNRAAIDLRNDIAAGEAVGPHTQAAPRWPAPPAGEGEGAAPWLLQRLAEPNHPRDPGRPGRRVPIVSPEEYVPATPRQGGDDDAN